MRPTIPLLIAVVLAGCLGGANPVPAGADDGPPDAAWAHGDGINTTALARHHFGALRGAGSFTANHSEAIRVEGDARPDGGRPEGYHPPTTVRHRVDLDGGRYLGAYVTVGGRRSDHFVTPEVTAMRRKPCPSDGCDYEYSYQRRPETDTLSERIDRFRTREAVRRFARLLRGVTAGFDYMYAGTVRRDGETLYRYRAHGSLDSAPPPFSEPPRGTATILVTGDGVVRRFELRYAGNATVSDGGERTVDVTHTFVRTYTAVGGTTVERPAWVERAAAEDPPRRTETGSA